MKAKLALFTITTFIVVFSIPPGFVTAQQNFSKDGFWLQGGIAGTTLGTGITANLTYDMNRHLFTLRGISTDNNFENDVWEVGFLYGRGFTYQNFYLSTGAGFSVVGGTDYSRLMGGAPNGDLEPMMGFPLDVQASWVPNSVMAIGVQAFANINTVQPFGGAGLVVRLGRVR